MLAALAAIAALGAVHAQSQPCPWPTTLGFYSLTCDGEGNIVSPWGPTLAPALHAAMRWYQASPPASHGYPTWMCVPHAHAQRKGSL
jgi:hypothetical protein